MFRLHVWRKFVYWADLLGIGVRMRDGTYWKEQQQRHGWED